MASLSGAAPAPAAEASPELEFPIPESAASLLRDDASTPPPAHADGKRDGGEKSDAAASAVQPIAVKAPAAALPSATSVGIAADEPLDPRSDGGEGGSLADDEKSQPGADKNIPPSPGTQKIQRRAIAEAMNALQLSEAQFLPSPEQELNVVRFLRSAFPLRGCTLSASDRLFSIFAVQLAWAIWTLSLIHI